MHTILLQERARESAFLRWGRTYLGAWPRAGEIRVVCASILAVSLVLTGLSLSFGFRDIPAFGRELGGDFLQFYVAGQILNEHPPQQIYDIQLEHRLQHEIRPGYASDLTLVYANTPWLALMFKPFARVPYIWAYILWLAISGTLYVSGFLLIWPRGEPFDKARLTALLIAVSFFPFAFECWFGGQLSSLGFFALALCIRLQRSGRLFASGMALALCTYKPTMLLLLVPMLAIGRRFRTLLGFSLGASALGGISFLAVGLSGWIGYIQTLRLYGHIVSSGGSAQQLFKYVDLNSFLRLLFGGPSWSTFIIFLSLGGTTLVCLALAWLRSDRRNPDSESLLWAMTIAATLVLNVYVPIYDVALIDLSAILIAGVLLKQSQLHEFYASLTALYVVAFVTQYLAHQIHLQLITIFLFALGVMAFRLWARSGRAAPVAFNELTQVTQVKLEMDEDTHCDIAIRNSIARRPNRRPLPQIPDTRNVGLRVGGPR